MLLGVEGRCGCQAAHEHDSHKCTHFKVLHEQQVCLGINTGLGRHALVLRLAEHVPRRGGQREGRTTYSEEITRGHAVSPISSAHWAPCLGPAPAETPRRRPEVINIADTRDAGRHSVALLASCVLIMGRMSRNCLEASQPTMVRDERQKNRCPMSSESSKTGLNAANARHSRISTIVALSKHLCLEPPSDGASKTSWNSWMKCNMYRGHNLYILGANEQNNGRPDPPR